MSHFTVMVIGDDPECQLKPYQENNMGDCPKEFLTFHDVEDEYLKQYKTDSVEKVVMSDGRLLNTWDDSFKVKGPNLFDDKTIIPPNLKKKKVKFTKLFKTFEEYMNDWCGFKSRDSKKNRYGYWENPNKKWDWYQLGGRWSGFFKLKANAIMTVKSEKPGWVDQAYKRDIDFVGMRNHVADEAAERYDRVARLLGGQIPTISLSWETFLKRKGNIDTKRKQYHAQPALKAVEKVRQENLSSEDKNCLTWLNLEDYQSGRTEYIAKAMRDAISTFAVIKDGKWYERGEMGWWACVSNEKDKGEWTKEFEKLLNSISEDTMLSVFDCHI